MSATETFSELVEKKMKSPAIMSLPEDERRQKAVIAVAKSHKALHREYLSECNPGLKAQRLLAEKLS